jgi:hypothetical protein
MGKIRLRMEETPRYESAPSTTPYRISTVSHWIPGVEGLLVPNPSYMDRNDEIRNNLSPTAQFLDRYAPSGNIRMRSYINQIAPFLHLAGLDGTVAAGAGTNEHNTVSQGGTWTGGTFTVTSPTLTITSNPIPWNATAAQMQEILEGTSVAPTAATFGRGNVECTGGPLPATPIVVKFVGLHAAKVLTTLTGNATGLTGTTPTVSVAKTQTGAAGAVLDPDGNGIPTGATRIQYAKRAGATPKSADIQISYDDVSMFLQGQGYGVTQVALPGSMDFSVDMLGLFLDEISDPGVSAALDTSTIIPLRAPRLLLTWLSGGANVETGSFGFNLANPIEAKGHHGIRSDFPTLLQYAGQDGGIVRLTGNLTAHQFDDQDWDAMMSAGPFTATADYLGDTKISTSGAYYRMWIEMAAAQLVGGGPEGLKNMRRHGASWEFSSAYSESAGYDFRITLLSGVTALETYV